MVVGEHHVVHVGAVGVHSFHIAGYPLAGMTFCAGQHGHRQLATPYGIVVAAVEQHRRPVGHDVEGRFGHACIDKMDLQLSGLPSRPGATHEFVLCPSGKCCLPVNHACCAGQGRCAQEITSVHMSSLVRFVVSFCKYTIKIRHGHLWSEVFFSVARGGKHSCV